jgi:hypothetical protein
MPMPKFAMLIPTRSSPTLSQSNADTKCATVRIACSFAKCLPGHIFQPEPYGIHDPSTSLVQNSIRSPLIFKNRPGQKTSTGGASVPLRHQMLGSIWPGVELATVKLPFGISQPLSRVSC